MNKKKMISKKLFLFIITFLAAILQPKQNVKAYDLTALSVDFKTGVIYKSVGNIDQKLKVASVSKLLTHYVIFDKIAKGEINVETKVEISQEIAEYSVQPMLSNVPLIANQQYKFDDLLKASIITSANAATTALAINVAGSELNFLKIADDTAKNLGLKNYSLVNTTGLSNDLVTPSLQNPTVEKTAENEFSARDLAILTRALYQDFSIPQIDYYSTVEFEFTTSPNQVNKYLNTNKMLPNQLYDYPGVKGVKTGTSLSAGANLITKANIREDLTLIGVVLNAENDDQRYRKMEEILNFKIRNEPYESLIINPEKSIYKDIPIKRSYQTNTNGTYKDELRVLIINSDDLKNITYQFISKDGKDYIKGNFKTNDQIGSVKIIIPNMAFLTKEDEEKFQLPVYATEDINEKNIIDNITDTINNFFDKLFK